MESNGKLKIVFVPRRSRIRPYKIAKALKSTGKVHLILLCEESFYDKNLFPGIFDEVHFYTHQTWFFRLPKAEKIYRRINERIGFGFRRMIKIIDGIKPDIIHCFAEPYNHIEHILRSTRCPVIMTDGADFTGITEGIERISENIKLSEKYCFENVAGIIHKGPEYEIEYYKEHGYKIECPHMTWFDYCDDDLIQVRAENKFKNEGEIHVVYTGNISTDPSQIYAYYVDFAKSMASQQVHFHIYPNPYQFSHAKEYRKLAEESPYFHFHPSLPYTSVPAEISKYDWGLWWHDPGGGKRFTEIKSQVSIGNKMFTYIEAGLPVIVGRNNTYGMEIIESKKIGITITRDDIPKLREKLMAGYAGYSENVGKTAREFSITGNAAPLLDFYKSVLARPGSTSH